MSISKITPIVKFAECFGISNDFILRENITEADFIDKGINVNEFKRFLVKNDMDEYAFYLLYYFAITFPENNEKDIEILFEDIDIVNERNLQYEIDLTTALLFLFTDKSSKNLSLTFYKSTSSVSIKNDQIIRNLANQLYLDFVKNNFHKIPLTYQEAKDKMLSNEKFASYVYKDINIGTDANPIFEKQECDYNIKYFAEKSPYVIDINKETLEAKLTNLTSNGKKRGAKIKNRSLADLCESLSFLKRIDKYLEQSDTENICDLILTNEDCRFIYSCLVFFKIIEEKPKSDLKNRPENHIRSILKQKKKDSWAIEEIWDSKTTKILKLKIQNNKPLS